jgi:hypothetical protein
MMEQELQTLRLQLQEAVGAAEAAEHRIEALEAFTNYYSRLLSGLGSLLDPATRDKVREDRSSAAFIISNEICRPVQGVIDELEANLNERLGQLSYTVKDHIVDTNEQVKRLNDYSERSQTRESGFTERLSNVDAFLDRLTRSIDDVLLEVGDRAPLSEVAKLEEKFKDYTPLEVVESVLAEVDLRATKETLAALDGKADEIRSSLANYMPTHKEAEIKAELTGSISRKLEGYALWDDLKEFKSEVQGGLYELRSYAEDNFGYSQERDQMIKSEVDQVKALVQRKPWTADLRPVLKDLETKATRKELEKFHSEVTPSLADCFKRIAEGRSELTRFDRALARFDEIICEKASKDDIMDVKRSLKSFVVETTFIRKVLEFEGMFREADQKTIEVKEELPKLHLMIQELKVQLNAQKQEVRDYKLVYNTLMELRDRIDSKADLSDLVKISERSALWSDTEALKQQTELLKRQVESTAVLTASLARTMLKDIDTPAVKYRRRAEVYRLLLSMLDWVRTNKASGVPEELSEFSAVTEHSFMTPRSLKSPQTIGLDLLKPRLEKRSTSLASQRERRSDLPPIKINSAISIQSNL